MKKMHLFLHQLHIQQNLFQQKYFEAGNCLLLLPEYQVYFNDNAKLIYFRVQSQICVESCAAAVGHFLNLQNGSRF